MKKLNGIGRGKRAQQGFTIIELVVVILLLGILTATALPRFMDVTDSAHNAVFEGVTGGFTTGVGLYHAQWIANGQPGVGNGLTGFGDGTLGPSSAGYPVEDSGGDGDLSEGADCQEIFIGLLQGGRPTISNASGLTSAAVISDLTFDGNDFIALAEDADTCSFWYMAQGAGVSSPGLRYETATGDVTVATEL